MMKDYVRNFYAYLSVIADRPHLTKSLYKSIIKEAKEDVLKSLFEIVVNAALGGFDRIALGQDRKLLRNNQRFLERISLKSHQIDAWDHKQFRRVAASDKAYSLFPILVRLTLNNSSYEEEG